MGGGCCTSRRTKLRLIFIGLTLLSIIINLDGGAVPAALIRIEQTYSLSTAEIGLLGMLVYEGIGWGSLLVGPMLRHVSAIRATQVTLFLNMCCTFAFGASTSVPMLLIFRFLIGLLQAIPAVYFPVWVDEFAPADATTVWMAVIQAGAPLGIMSGYVFSASVTMAAPDPTAICPASAVFDSRCAWRWPFFLQSIVLVAFSIASLFVPKNLYDLDARDYDPDALEEEEGWGSEEGAHPSSRASSRQRGESMVDTIGAYVTEAFLPMDARAPIEGVGVIRGSSIGGSSVGGSAPSSPMNAERSERMENRIRRMSSTPVFTIEAPVEPNGEGGEGARPPQQAGVPGSVGLAEEGTTPGRMSQVHERMSRMSQRGRLTMRDGTEEGGGRAHVVSAIELFAPLQPRSPGSPSSRSSFTISSRSGNGSGPASHGAGDLKSVGEEEDAPAPTLAEMSGRSNGSAGEKKPRRSPICELLTNGVYVTVVMSLASLFFVVTGIQFWVTKYILQIILNGSDLGQEAVTAAFGATSIIAPIFGVVCGGIHIDRIGGYKGADGLAKTLRSCFVFATIAGIFAITTAYVPKRISDGGNPEAGFVTMISLIAIVLIFGGAVIPAATGCIISVVHPSLRQLSSAGSMFCFQQLGYAASPFISGQVAGLVTIDPQEVLATLNLTGINATAAETIREDAISRAQTIAELDVCLQVGVAPERAPTPIFNPP